MRLLITADLHYNHPRSKPVARDLIERMNRMGGDILLLIGDTAVADGDELEQCLSLFKFSGPKLLVPGNHELWTRGPDSFAIHEVDLPRRVAALGWRWLPAEPFVAGEWGCVGSLGWYDFSFAQANLGIPLRFYARKVSPGYAEARSEFADLKPEADDVPESARQIVARWNDGVHIKLGRSDEAFVDELLQRLESQLQAMSGVKQIMAAIHCLPFAQLLPPPHSAQWDFGKAFLGSEKIGRMLLKYPNVVQVYCGHSHFPARAKIGPIRAVNVGSGYRAKRVITVDV